MSCSINLYCFNSNYQTQTIVTIRSHATRSSHLHSIRQSIVFVFMTTVLSNNKHIAAQPTNNGDQAKQLSPKADGCHTNTTRPTMSVRFCNDDTLFHTAPDRGCKSNVPHCFAPAQPSTTPCVGYFSRPTTTSTHTVTC
jgi:hypothetical protein